MARRHLPPGPQLPLRRRALYGLGALAASGWLASCGGRTTIRARGESGATGPAQGTPQPAPAGPLTEARLTLSPTAVGNVGPAFAGFSYEKRALAVPRFTPDNANMVGMFRGLGTSLLRIGGNTVDQVQWTRDGPGRTHGQVAPRDVDALAGFIERCGWQVLYGVNLATSTPAAAADEVAYAAQALGPHLYGIQIGNEPDQYRGEYFPSWTLDDFEQRWELFRVSILKRTPQVLVTGPGNSTNVDSWTIPFARYAGSRQIGLLTQHYYRGNGRSPGATAAALISPDTTLGGELARLRASAMQIGVPFRLGETNSYFAGGAPGVSNSYASALWVIDHLFSIAQGGGAGANLHGGGNGNGYTPIADRAGTVVEARPVYYGMLLFTLTGQGPVLQCRLAAAGLNASAYALQRADGSLAVMVVNKDATKNLRLTLDCGRQVRSATLVAMSAPALEATSGVEIQGATVAVDGSFAPQPAHVLATTGSEVSCYVSALGATLVMVE